jgi:succinylarginine dihydrolase
MSLVEVNFDGLIGPTHNYAGLSWGNVASISNKLSVSNPREAALQGLTKMKMLMELGLRQAVLPPQERPHLPTLRALGYTGSDAAIVSRVAKENPVLLASCSSASAMWAANAATISPSPDTADARVHITPANLHTQFHRSIEASATARVLGAIFPDEKRFAHHPPLLASSFLADEGAANHTRLWTADGSAPGVEIFTFGRGGEQSHAPSRYPARQTLEASQAVARLHGLSAGRVLFVQQNPAAIDAGAFHNDVVCVGHRNVLLMHELAFENQPAIKTQLRQMFSDSGADSLFLLEVEQSSLSLADAIATYLFNSQLVTLTDGSICLIAPIECLEHAGARQVIQNIIAADNPVASVRYIDVRQSMRNGGGPACLRLRVQLNESELNSALPSVFLTPALVDELERWVCKHYR